MSDSSIHDHSAAKQPAGDQPAGGQPAGIEPPVIRKRQRAVFMTAMALAIMLNPLNTTTISVALAHIQEDFTLSFSQLSWLISTYYLVSAIGQPVAGKLGDQFGRRKFFVGGLILSAVASLLAAFSPSFLWLVVFRMLLGLGTSSVYTSCMALVRHHVSDAQAKMIGILTMSMSASSAIGPFIGGLLVEYGDWPAIFLINLLLIAISFALAFRLLPRDEVKREERIRIDLPGIGLFSALVFCLLWFFLSLETGPVWWLPAAGALFAFLFVRLESRKDQPFINVTFLRRNPVVSRIYLQYLLHNAVFYSFLFGIPIYLQNVRGLAPQQAGLMWLLSAGSSVVANGVVNRYVSRNGPKRIVLFGGLCMLCASAAMALLTDRAPLAIIAGMLVLNGFGNGWTNYGLQTSLYAFIRKADTGVAAGLLMTSRYIGTIVTSGILGVMFGTSITTGHLREVGVTIIVIASVVLLMALRIPKVRLDS